MARTKRPRAPSTGGSCDSDQTALDRVAKSKTSNELAESLVEAHLEGHLQRKRLHMFEKGRLNQDLERCLKANLETLKKRMHRGEETVEFCFAHTYHEYEPNQEDVRAALPPELKALSELQWLGSARLLATKVFTVTVTGVSRAHTTKRDWVIGIEVDKDYLQDARATALNAALERGDAVEKE